MDPLIVTIIAVAAFLLFISQGVPIAFAFAIVGCAGIALYRGLDVGLWTLAHVQFQWATSQMILSMPLFILMGLLAFHTGISQDLYKVSYKWFGMLPGGIAMATTVASAGFAACCGAAVAGSATMASIAFPEMQKLNYDRRLSTGCISAGGTLSIIIPPSIPLIIYGFLAETSIAKLFVAGIIPGIFLSGVFLITIYIQCKLNPSLGPPGPSFNWRERFASLRGIWSMLLLSTLVIGGLWFGIFTPTEAGAMGAFGAFVIALVRRRLTFTTFIAATKESVRLTAFIVTIIIGAGIFNIFLGVSGVSKILNEWITTISVSPYIILICIIAIYIFLGMIMDIMAIILLTIPTIVPIIVSLGFDPVWFGIIITLIAQIGYISPPVGLSVFVVHGVTNVPMEDIFRGIIPFFIAMVVCLAILVAFPQITLFLPSFMM